MKKLWLALLLVLFAAVPAFAAPLTIAVYEQVLVKGPFVTLGEIADFSGHDTARIEKLRELKLGSAPAPGASLVLTQELLGIRLASAGVDLSGIVWQTPQTILITTGSQAVSSETLASVARQAVLSRMAGHSGEFVVNIASYPADLLVPAGSVTVTADVPAGVRFAAPTVAYVTVSVDGKRFSTVPVKLDVRLYEQILVATRAIGAQELITDDNTRLERLDAGRLTGYITDASQALGLISRRNIAARTPLTGAMLMRPTLIKHGSVVTIVVRTGGIEVTATGQALQDGVQDQIIRVQNSNSKRIIAAQVVDSTTVLVATYNGKVR